MEHSVDCQLEDVQAPSGDDDVGRMSVITVESTSPLGSVHSVNSFADDMDEFMVGVDADAEEAANDGGNDAADVNLPVTDVALDSSVADEDSVEANDPMSPDSVWSNKVADREVIDDVDQSDALLDNTATATKNAGENSVTVNDTLHFPSAGSLDKCEDGMKLTSERTSALESGIILQLFEID